MRKIAFILFIVLIATECIPQNGIFPGMSISTFRIAMPGRIPASLPFNENIHYPETINGTQGNWEFGFTRSILETATFTTTPDYLSWPLDTNTEKYRKTGAVNRTKFNNLLAYYTAKYGMPDRRKTKLLELDPKKTNHSLEIDVAEWDFNGMTVSVKLIFDGDNPEYMVLNNSDVSMYAFRNEIVFTKNDIKNLKAFSGKYHLLMNVSDFIAQNNDILSGTYESGQPNYRETIYGLDGYWHYTFEKDTLDWYGYSFYINDAEELTEENFNRCLEAARKLIDEYTGYFGKPDELKEGKTEFIDPYQMRHWGYDVVEAKWIQDNLKCKVEFSFFGGKGQYFFQVLIKCFRPDYPYFD